MLKAHKANHALVNDCHRSKDHYSIRLLKGYGVSINLKDNRICLKGSHDPFIDEKETEEWFVTQIPYDRIVVSGKGYL